MRRWARKALGWLGMLSASAVMFFGSGLIFDGVVAEQFAVYTRALAIIIGLVLFVLGAYYAVIALELTEE